jgi:hypothetical protein
VKPCSRGTVIPGDRHDPPRLSSDGPRFKEQWRIIHPTFENSLETQPFQNQKALSALMGFDGILWYPVDQFLPALPQFFHQMVRSNVVRWTCFNGGIYRVNQANQVSAGFNQFVHLPSPCRTHLGRDGHEKPIEVKFVRNLKRSGKGPTCSRR